jgi:hypothetical protein
VTRVSKHQRNQNKNGSLRSKSSAATIALVVVLRPLQPAEAVGKNLEGLWAHPLADPGQKMSRSPGRVISRTEGFNRDRPQAGPEMFIRSPAPQTILLYP